MNKLSAVFKFAKHECDDVCMASQIVKADRFLIMRSTLTSCDRFYKRSFAKLRFAVTVALPTCFRVFSTLAPTPWYTFYWVFPAIKRAARLGRLDEKDLPELPRADNPCRLCIQRG